MSRPHIIIICIAVFFLNGSARPLKADPKKDLTKSIIENPVPIEMDGQIMVIFNDPCSAEPRSVLVDDQVAGTTNAYLTVQAGNHSINLSGAGYTPEFQVVDVRYGNIKTLEFSPSQEGSQCENE